MPSEVNLSRWREELARIRNKFGCNDCAHADQDCIMKQEPCCAHPEGPHYSEVMSACMNRKKRA